MGAAFNSAFVFYTILKQFGDRDEQIVEAAKYCMFKTTDILKALKEGRKPKPGPPGDDLEDEFGAELNALNTEDSNVNNVNNNDLNQPSQPQPNYNQNNIKSPSPQPMPPPNNYQNNQYNANQFNNHNNVNQKGFNENGQYFVNNGPSYNYQKQVKLPQFESKVTACVEAEKTLKESMAALRFEDVDTAIKKAEEAIAILKPHNR